jgi:hypothetical protein
MAAVFQHITEKIQRIQIQIQNSNSIQIQRKAKRGREPRFHPRQPISGLLACDWSRYYYYYYYYNHGQMSHHQLLLVSLTK